MLIAMSVLTSMLIGSSSLPQNERVIRGWEATPGQFPWMVSIQNLGLYHMCGGAIISPRHVLTAAHCRPPKLKLEDMKILAGAHNQSNKSEPTQQMRSICRFEHRNESLSYVWPSPGYDIAVITLTTPLVFNDRVRPIRLGQAIVPVGTNCIISGWGISNISDADFIAVFADTLQFLNMTAISNEDCSKRPLNPEPNDTVTPPDLTLPIYDPMLCMIYPGGWRTPFKSDSGSPLTCFDDQGPYVAGVVSWGSIYYESMNSSTCVFERVSYNYDFITCGRNKDRR